MEKNYRTVTIQELSSHFHYRRRQLVRIIKETTGETFAEAIRKRKMKRAEELLTGTIFPVSVIAQECGCENTTGFIRAFRQQYKRTPAAFRREENPKGQGKAR